MTAQTVFDIKELRDEIMTMRTQALLKQRREIEKERIKMCQAIYPEWGEYRGPQQLNCTLKIIRVTDEYRWNVVHNDTVLSYPVTHEWLLANEHKKEKMTEKYIKRLMH